MPWPAARDLRYASAEPRALARWLAGVVGGRQVWNAAEGLCPCAYALSTGCRRIPHGSTNLGRTPAPVRPLITPRVPRRGPPGARAITDRLPMRRTHGNLVPWGTPDSGGDLGIPGIATPPDP
jgi:hypothetical protein